MAQVVTPESAGASAREKTVDAVVIGAGFAGLYAMYRLREMGLSVAGFEAGTDVGGTWYWNRYPGARCDVESMAYSYSFSPELEQEWDWSEKYPTQPEVLRYLRHVADRFDLRRSFQFETRVVRAAFDAEKSRWTIRTNKDDVVSAQFCISAVGCLSEPKPPETPGLETFQGTWYHTGRWPHEPVDFTGRRIGVIGTGSSGVQSIPVIAAQAAALTVFQRTAAYSLPSQNEPLADEARRSMKLNYPEFRKLQRESTFGGPGSVPTESALAVSPEQRRLKYEQAWSDGRANSMLGAYNDLFLKKEANDTAAEFVRGKIRETVHDASTAEDLCPTTYPLGTKRLILDTNYFETYNRDNVRLVNLRKTPILEITPHGIQTADAHYELDVIVFAVGFDAMTGALSAVDFRGKDGDSLASKWADGPHTYLGLAVSDFPNLFTITGPGSPSVLGNVVVSIEQHVDWIADCLTYMREHGFRSVEATSAAQEGWTDRVQRMAEKTLMVQADSWYMGANVPGKPRVFMAYLGGLGSYRKRCAQVAAEGYSGFIFK